MLIHICHQASTTMFTYTYTTCFTIGDVCYSLMIVVACCPCQMYDCWSKYCPLIHVHSLTLKKDEAKPHVARVGSNLCLVSQPCVVTHSIDFNQEMYVHLSGVVSLVLLQFHPRTKLTIVCL